MDTPNIQLGELMEKGQSAATNTVKTAISDAANSASGQIGINETNASKTQNQQQAQSQPGQGTEQITNANQNNPGNEFTREMVEDFYAPSAQTAQSASEQQEEAQTQQRLSEVRKKLYQERHNEVYFNAVLNADAPKKQEERPAERVERQEMEDLQSEEKKKQSQLPLAVQRAQTHIEVSPGISG